MPENDWWYKDMLKDIIGKTMVSVTQSKDGSPDKSDAIDFVASTGEHYQMRYEPDCCASCYIEDVVGDLNDLVGSPIVMAEESTNSDNPKSNYGYEDDSFTWTFYKLATVKGYVTIRWYGSSNGYYSETASFRRIA